MTDQDQPQDDAAASEDGPRTEGVRIIGAQEAAEAVGRPDVARRRRRGEKRFGDRPDEPEPASDLPKIRISTSESAPEVAEPDRFGAIPVVRPGSQEPRWADDDEGFVARPEQDAGRSYGHARVVDDGPAAVAEDPAPEPEPDVADFVSGGAGGGSPRGGSDDAVAGSGGFDAGGFDDGGFEEIAEEDSFVLPHWTEPPTGQVPKVVIGEEAPEEEGLAAYGSQPRWRDEGERTVETDFDDLIDDGPRLGALGGDQSSTREEDDEEIDFFTDEPDDRDPLEAFAPEERPFGDERPARRRRRPQPDAGPDDGGHDDGGGRPPGGGDRNLPVAVAVGVGLVALGLICFSLGGLATTLLACVVVGAAAFEYFTAVQQKGFNAASMLGMASVVGLLLATYFGGLGAYPIVLTLTVVLGLLWYLWVAPGEHSVRNLGITLLGIMWIGFLGSFATLFLGLGKVIEDANPKVTSNIGIGVLIAAVIASVAHDVGAYFVGRFMGQTPLSAASPNKTMEGLAGGVITSLVATVVLVGFVGIAPIGGNIFRVFVFALLCAVVAPLGDLCESFIKRDLGIKDMGSILPGHGGVLDRFDALLFVLPTAYFVTILFEIW